jgi:DNA-binding CsgD family transcriptional regulator
MAFDQDRAERHIAYLTDRDLAGRQAGAPGAESAADYIADRFSDYGLIPAGDNDTYLQTFPISFTTAYDGRQKFLLNSLLVYGANGDERLLHLCHRPDEAAEHAVHVHETLKAPVNHVRNSLTHREVEVLALLGDGMTTHEIASVMCISEATVRNHIQHLLGKLHVHNRLEAVVIGQRLDLI